MCVVKRLPDAMNAHGLQAMLDSFHEDQAASSRCIQDGASRAENRSGRTGPPSSTQCRSSLRTWSTSVVTTIRWSDWRWSGTRQDGSRLDVAGVIVAGVRDRRIAWARLYMEPVEAAQESIDVAVRSMASGA